MYVVAAPHGFSLQTPLQKVRGALAVRPSMYQFRFLRRRLRRRLHRYFNATTIDVACRAVAVRTQAHE
jgi:hypothetical protein